MTLAKSDFILNDDGSIYHLNLLPGDIASTIITVGDPDRVSAITKYFDRIEISKQKREFKTETGWYNGKRLTVISTGIGTDNIDIVFNELDALVNIDFNTRTVKKELTVLTFVRIGTSGTIQADIPVNSFVRSDMAIGFDGLLHYYQSEQLNDTDLVDTLISTLNWDQNKSKPYIVRCDSKLAEAFNTTEIISGITATNIGFYGPQTRKLRLALQDEQLNNKLANTPLNGHKITNLEMETAGIYGMAGLLGHKAISLSAILANRANGTFSQTPNQTIDKLIRYCLQKLITDCNEGDYEEN